MSEVVEQDFDISEYEDQVSSDWIKLTWLPSELSDQRGE
jgi:hypothetical protein